MLTLQELDVSSNELLDKMLAKQVPAPEVSIQWQRRLEALQLNHLWKQYQIALFDMRCEQAEQLGFAKMSSEVLVETLMGQPPNETVAVGERHRHEWVYNHHTDVVLAGADCTWGGQATEFVLYGIERKGRLIKTRHRKEIWRCRFDKLNYLAQPIPYGVALKLLELKEMKLFNAFNVLAPVEAWESKTDIDPILVGSIWQVTSTNDKQDEYKTAGLVSHFFVAKW